VRVLLLIRTHLANPDKEAGQEGCGSLEQLGQQPLQGPLLPSNFVDVKGRMVWELPFSAIRPVGSCQAETPWHGEACHTCLD
jgi:hypothetical protein